ncbi:hypothetical protein [Salinifilum ghardaiensis]
MGFWIHLLEAGGHVGRPPHRSRRNYDELLWKPALHRAFPGARGTRTGVRAALHRLHALRNRIAHHEPIIHGLRQPGAARSAPDAYSGPDELHGDLVTMLRWISPDVGEWLATCSRTSSILDRSP